MIIDLPVENTNPKLVPSLNKDPQVTLNCENVETFTQEFVVSLCTELKTRKVDVVRLKGASEGFEESFMRAHYVTNSKFSVQMA